MVSRDETVRMPPVRGDGLIEVVAAQRRIAVGGEHFEHATRKLQDGNIESTAAQVEYGKCACAGVVEAIRDSGRGRFIQQTQYIDAGEPCCIFRGLALGVV